MATYYYSWNWHREYEKNLRPIRDKARGSGTLRFILYLILGLGCFSATLLLIGMKGWQVFLIVLPLIVMSLLAICLGATRGFLRTVKISEKGFSGTTERGEKFSAGWERISSVQIKFVGEHPVVRVNVLRGRGFEINPRFTRIEDIAGFVASKCMEMHIRLDCANCEYFPKAGFRRGHFGRDYNI